MTAAFGISFEASAEVTHADGTTDSVESETTTTQEG